MSITHDHLLACVNAELARRPRPGTVRILDMGCGDGQLLGFLHENLPLQNPGVEFELFGYDVGDSGVQSEGFLASAVQELRRRAPEVPWINRVVMISASDAWPFDADSFDFVISNQVLEHVADHAFAFRQIARALKPGGVSLHLFPLTRYWMEGHLLMPFVHWIHDHDLSFWWIRFMNKMGVGIYSPAKAALPGAEPFEEHVERHADYMAFNVNYIEARDLARCARAAGLRFGFRYTSEFYLAKLREVLGREPKRVYSAKLRPALEALAFPILSRVSGITMRLEKTNAYRSKSGYTLRAPPRNP